MDVLLVSFWLRGMSDADYREMCAQLRPAVDAEPGLVDATWMANRESGTYGALLRWRDRESLEAFTRSTLYRAMATHPHLEDFAAETFEVLGAASHAGAERVPVGAGV